MNKWKYKLLKFSIDSASTRSRVDCLSIMVALFLFFIVSLNAVNYFPVNWGSVDDNTRGTSIFYHNSNVDQLWYGTDAWAVRYDIKAYTTLIDSLSLHSIKTYFPNSEGSYSVKVYTDHLQPLKSLVYQKDNIDVNAGWNEVRLNANEYVADSVFWVVIEYKTDRDDKFMAASAIRGDNSYYWKPEQGNVAGYFAPFGEDNATTELLVTITGELVSKKIDLELTSFKFAERIKAGGSITPIITVKNNSSIHINDSVSLKIDLTNPSSDSIDFGNDPRAIDLAPGDECEVKFPAATLSKDPSQYHLKATLEFEHDIFQKNNTISFFFDTLSDPLETILIENFVKIDNSQSRKILEAQDSLIDLPIYQLNYFFHPSDTTYYNPESANRKDFYNLPGYPFTIINGKASITGYSASYIDTLKDKIEEATSKNTFIRNVPRDEVREVNLTDLTLSLRFTVRNIWSNILPTVNNNLKIFIAVAENGITGLSGNTLVHLYEHPDKIELDRGQSFAINRFSLNLKAIETVGEPISRNNLHRFSFIYWVQDIAAGDIYYVNGAKLDECTLNVQDETLPYVATTISVHPNPFVGNEDIVISLHSSEAVGETINNIKIYNIKGQVIKSISGSLANKVNWNGITDDGSIAPNGIYLMKVETSPLKQVGTPKHQPQYKKISIINSK